TFSTLLTKSKPGGALVLLGGLKSNPVGMPLPRKTAPVSRLVTMRSRSFTSLMAAPGLPGGSVHTSVTRNGTSWPSADKPSTQVWRWPVARVLVGLWSKNRRGQVLGSAFVSAAGRLLVRLTNPQPWILTALVTPRS